MHRFRSGKKTASGLVNAGTLGELRLRAVPSSTEQKAQMSQLSASVITLAATLSQAGAADAGALSPPRYLR
jgi:hypothetical protein